jgi:putative alpha-1,2-mannosidase
LQFFSAYYGTDPVIYGFSQTHLNGTGCSDYGDILVMPVTGDVRLANYYYLSSFHAAPEDGEASPGYYKVFLDKYHIKAELTVTERAGFHRYTYPAAKNAGIVIDLKHRDKVLESSLKLISDTELAGMPARYIRMIARNRGICPPWHPGAGNKAMIFADEISIE